MRRFPRGKTSYRFVYVDGKQQLEHRVVMSNHLKRPLKRSEVVHHKDENGLHNDIDNLVLTSRSHHRRMHMKTRKWPVAEGIQMRRAGATLRAIALHFGVTGGAVRLAFLRRNISTKDTRHGANRWPVEKALARYKRGATLASLSRAYAVTAQSIRKAFMKRGVIVKRRAASE